jgi:FkbM family methyltransferase
VGSNLGNWSLSVVPNLKLSPDGTLILIDPVRESSSETKSQLNKHLKVISFLKAVGSKTEVRTINVASNGGESSSFLDFATPHQAAAPQVSFIETRDVQIDTLDNLCHSILGNRNTLLKLDVQGYELEALLGADKLLRQTSVVVVEASLREIYKKGSTLFSISEYLGSRGFHLGGLVESFSEKNYGEMLQMDAVFFRTSIN